jgi:hypothetical protein
MLSSARTQPGAKALTYLHSAKTASRVKPVTHWVAADLSHQRGRSLAAAAVGFLQDAEDEYEPAFSRVALLLAPKGAASALDVAVATALKVGKHLRAFYLVLHMLCGRWLVLGLAKCGVMCRCML